MGGAGSHVVLHCSMTDGAQQALRRTMEVYSKTTRFALACNNSDQIIGVFICLYYHICEKFQGRKVSLLSRIYENHENFSAQDLCTYLSIDI